MKKILRILLSFSLLIVFAFSACNIFQSPTKEEKELFNAIENGKIDRFDEIELSLKENVESVIWKSSNESVAVIEDGKLIGISAGTAVITASVGNENQTQTITVVDNGVAPIMNFDNLPLLKGDSFTLNPTTYFKGRVMEDVTYEYTVADVSIASVDGNVFTGESYGSTNVEIKMSWRGNLIKTETIVCTVNENKGVYTNKLTYDLYIVGNVLDATFAVSDTIETTVFNEGNKIENVTFTWTSANEEVASVDEAGVITAVGVGETTVLGTANVDGEEFVTRAIPVSVNNPYLKTNIDVLYDVNSGSTMTWDATQVLGEGYSIGKIVELEDNKEYEITDNMLDVSNFSLGEYQVAVYEESGLFATEVKLVFADYIIRTAKELQEMKPETHKYIVLANDLPNVGVYMADYNDAYKKDYIAKFFGGVFNGLGHTISGIIFTRDKLGLFGYTRGSTFMNVSIIAESRIDQHGVFCYNGDTITVDNVYIDITFTGNSRLCGAIGDIIFNSLVISNSMIVTNGTELNGTDCGAILARAAWISVTFDNTYVISDGRLCSLSTDSHNPNQGNVNAKKNGVLYQNKIAFEKAKQEGKLDFSGYNGYWDFSDVIPTI